MVLIPMSSALLRCCQLILICDSVIFLKNGELVFNGSVDQLIKDNIKPQVHIRYRENNDFLSMEVKDADKNIEIKKLIEFIPFITLSLIRVCPLWQYKNFVDRDRLMGGLDKAGMAKTQYDLLY